MMRMIGILLVYRLIYLGVRNSGTYTHSLKKFRQKESALETRILVLDLVILSHQSYSLHIREGTVCLPDGTLAGSVLTMERALQNICAATGRPLAEMWVTSSLNAARAIGVSSQKGSLEVGKHADLVLLDDSFHVKLTVIEGEVVFSSSENLIAA
jgi:dihydroorotase-like cyclic amidohydrolase